MLQDRANAAVYFIRWVFAPICNAQPVMDRNIKQIDSGCHGDRFNEVEA
jgi:hypothetical protein